MAGQLADAGPGTVAAEVFERLGHLPVGPGPTGATEILVQGVLDEGVGEAVVPGVSASSRTRAAAVAASRMSSSVVFRCLGGPGQHVEVEVPADHRGQRQHPLGVWSQPPDAGADHRADAGGQRHRVEGVARRPIGRSASWSIAPVSAR